MTPTGGPGGHDAHEAPGGTVGQYDKGAAMMRQVYGGIVPPLPEGAMPFNDVMVRSLFAEVWDRDVLSVRDRRLLLMGVIAAAGATDVWRIQAAAALANGELSPDELRETLIILAPYAGYPNVAGLVLSCEEAINDWRANGGGTAGDGATGEGATAGGEP
jgi:4-carboxymuconolactone decarboxylase